ncbi:MAG: hypothetical protein AAB424_01530 [Patescibacteria group bacterium]
MGKVSERSLRLAHFEISWWQAHHRKQKDVLLKTMAQLYELQFGISYQQALAAVRKRVEAAGWHDRAEAAEDAGNQKKADLYWEKVEGCLQEHFQLLQEVC